MAPDTFDMLWDDAVATLGAKSKLYVTDRVVGADSSYALPVKVVTDWALAALFTDNMFRAVPDDIGQSVFADRPFTLLVGAVRQAGPGEVRGTAAQAAQWPDV